jgi:hypothetical protein
MKNSKHKHRCHFMIELWWTDPSSKEYYGVSERFTISESNIERQALVFIPALYSGGPDSIFDPKIGYPNWEFPCVSLLPEWKYWENNYDFPLHPFRLTT